MHRLEFERIIIPSDIHKGQVLRVLLQERISDLTGLVTNLQGDLVILVEITGLHEGRSIEFLRSKTRSITEILSCPLFYRIRQKVLGEKASKPTENIQWKQSKSSDKPVKDFENERKPRLL